MTIFQIVLFLALHLETTKAKQENTYCLDAPHIATKDGQQIKLQPGNYNLLEKSCINHGYGTGGRMFMLNITIEGGGV